MPMFSSEIPLLFIESAVVLIFEVSSPLRLHLLGSKVAEMKSTAVLLRFQQEGV
jgi:hypothetical protein